jgi:hypothetical protein
MQETCCFCSHANPVGAKFCNECGSPMNMRPCAHCDAVTPRGAGECHACHAPLEGVAYGMRELATPTERIMADADAMLAALKRDLEMAARPPAQEVAALPEAPTADVAEAPMPEPRMVPMAVMGERRDEAAEDVQVWGDPTPEPELEDRDEREWRPRRGRLVGMVVLALAFVVAPAVVWTQRNPEVVRAWGERLAAIANGLAPVPAQQSENAAVPEAPASTADTQQVVPPVDRANVEAAPPAESVPTPTASSEASDASVSRSADSPSAESADPPPVAAPVEQARSRSTKARSGSRSSSRSSRSASRERTRQ